MNFIRKKIKVQGQVQGIGFRPFVFRLAGKHKLTGFVFNYTEGVIIEIQGSQSNIDNFLDRLKNAHLENALIKIKSLETLDIESIEDEKDFEIKQSKSSGAISAEVTADIATCKDCLRELFDENDFRYRYPFINCTNCGPRYSIIKTIPYDRPNTTMSAFKMCDKCKQQYEDVADRRFHAQPVACPTCGPKIYLCDSNDKIIEDNCDKVIAKTVQFLKDGKIAAIKGLGGFHLACDAENEQTVKTLRSRKMRDAKPFAMMAEMENIKRFADVSEQAEKILRSIESPIVLLPKKQPNTIASSVAKGVSTFGFMLPYTPLHHLIFAEKKLNALVMTSGNISDEPLICKDDQAISKLGGIADIFLMHNREIYRQVDDSILHIIANEPALLRRSRGFVPQPINFKNPSSVDIFAAGSDLKNTFCLVKKNRFIVSEHIGDMEDSSVYKHWLSSIEHLKKLIDVNPKVVTCDIHPGYFSSQHARKLKADMTIEVQHHWAHIASVLAENDMNETVIGLVADGTGYGTDGAIWGCECLIASLDEFRRFAHLAYYPLPGGDLASKEAIRPLLGLMKKYNLSVPQSVLDEIEPDPKKRQTIELQIDKNINTVQTSSLGRLFDAVAALCGLGSYNQFEAQLPMALESIANIKIKENYPFELIDENGIISIGIKEMLESIIKERLSGVTPNVISSKFHNTIAEFLSELAKKASEKTGIKATAISGGVFCNRFLSERLIEMLQKNGFTVLFNRLLPANDGCVSLGQAAIAASVFAKTSAGKKP
ncbi:MAG: carbamoyltransferase HypF [Planctomycetes bacterium GWF2_41_51]|nr:MAG: carbamoyltransferase HypF [Planctomycetes bacterium GWF2_41_51]